MKTYHIMTLEDFHATMHLFDKTRGGHYMDLPTGKIIVAACFDRDEIEEQFHLALPNKIDLPHPMYEGNAPMGDEIAEHLHHWFTEHEKVEDRKKAASSATIAEIVRRAVARNPLFRVSVFPYRNGMGARSPQPTPPVNAADTPKP
jgi:hypothetical protein